MISRFPVTVLGFWKIRNQLKPPNLFCQITDGPNTPTGIVTFAGLHDDALLRLEIFDF